jgi:hypothetical protein
MVYYVLAGDIPDVPDFNGDPGGVPEDPLAPDGGVEGAIDKASTAALGAVGEITIPSGFSPDVLSAMPDTAGAVIGDAVKSVPVQPDGVMGKQVQAKVINEVSTPEGARDLGNDALGDAIEKAGSPANVTIDEVKASYQTEVEKRVKAASDQLKTEYKTALNDALNEPGFDANTPTETGKPLVDDMIDDPEGTEKRLNDEADKIEKENPDWKEKLKDAGKTLLSYGGKALLVMAVIGTFVPGGGNIVDKLAGMAGAAVDKLAKVAANLLKAFLGPILATAWAFLKKLKVPLMIIGLVIVIWMLKSLLRK